MTRSIAMQNLLSRLRDAPEQRIGCVDFSDDVSAAYAIVSERGEMFVSPYTIPPIQRTPAVAVDALATAMVLNVVYISGSRLSPSQVKALTSKPIALGHGYPPCAIIRVRKSKKA